MSFLRWLDHLNNGIDVALKTKRTVGMVLDAARAHDSVTEPIKSALEVVKGLKRNARQDQNETVREAPEAPSSKR